MKAQDLVGAAKVLGCFALVGAVGEWANDAQCRLGGALAGAAATYFLLMLFLSALAAMGDWRELRELPKWCRWTLTSGIILVWLYLTAGAVPRIARAFGCG